MSFFFGGDTGTTAESIKRKRRAAAAQIAWARPRNVGEGIALVGKALARRREWRRESGGVRT